MYLIKTNKIIWIFWIAINLSYLTFALRDVYVTVPTAVKRGDNATLICRYDLENDTLYSIKWYKGKREFYRYTPKEPTPMKVFSINGINVEKSMSNASNVMLTLMESSVSGKYSCEVSADAPTFHTGFQSAYLEVVDFPINGPVITNKDKVYSIGDILQANCTINNSKPQSNLTWLINNITVMAHHIVRYNFSKDDLLNAETSVLGLKLVLTPKHFRSKNLRLACKANIYEIYENTTEKLLDLDENSNQILADDFSTIDSSRHTQYDGNNDFYGYGNDPYDIKMHHIQASPDMASSATAIQGSSSKSPYLTFYFYSSMSIINLVPNLISIWNNQKFNVLTSSISILLYFFLFLVTISSISFNNNILNIISFIFIIISIVNLIKIQNKYYNNKKNFKKFFSMSSLTLLFSSSTLSLLSLEKFDEFFPLNTYNIIKTMKSVIKSCQQRIISMNISLKRRRTKRLNCNCSMSL